MSQPFRPPRLRLLVLWVAFLSLFGHAAGLSAQDDDCERLTSGGGTRDCTYLEEMRECIDDANESLDECIDDAAGQDTLLSWAVNLVGCEAASLVNLTACAVSVSEDWFGWL